MDFSLNLQHICMIYIKLRMVSNIEKPTYYQTKHWFNCNQLIRESPYYISTDKPKVIARTY